MTDIAVLPCCCIPNFIKIGSRVRPPNAHNCRMFNAPFISCRLDYCNALLYGIADGQLQRLQSVQNAAARLVTGTRRTDHITPVLQSLHWLPVRQRVTFKLATLVHNCLNGRAPGYLADDFRLAGRGRPDSRSAASMMLDIPRTTTSLGDKAFAVAGPRVWKLEQPSSCHP